MCMCLWGSEATDPHELDLQEMMIHLTWVLGNSPDPLQDQQVLLTVQPSLQPQEACLYKSVSLDFWVSLAWCYF